MLQDYIIKDVEDKDFDGNLSKLSNNEFLWTSKCLFVRADLFKDISLRNQFVEFLQKWRKKIMESNNLFIEEETLSVISPNEYLKIPCSISSRLTLRKSSTNESFIDNILAKDSLNSIMKEKKKDSTLECI